jgi:AraC-like DNA-binding protein
MEQEFLCELMQKYLIKPPGPERSFRLIVGVSELIRKLFDTREANCVETRDKAGDDPKGNLLQSINAYVRANLNKPLTIADLAKHTGYSISYLRAIFHREYGFSLGSYMRDSRLSMGTAMLAKGDSENIDRIAKACGFLSVFVFSRAFKKAMGISPSAYRRMLRKVQERR